MLPQGLGQPLQLPLLLLPSQRFGVVVWLYKREETGIERLPTTVRESRA